MGTMYVETKHNTNLIRLQIYVVLLFCRSAELSETLIPNVDVHSVQTSLVIVFIWFSGVNINPIGHNALFELLLKNHIWPWNIWRPFCFCVSKIWPKGAKVVPGWFLLGTSYSITINHKTSSIPRSTLSSKSTGLRAEYPCQTEYHLFNNNFPDMTIHWLKQSMKIPLWNSQHNFSLRKW